MYQLAKSEIDFSPKEALADDKTAGWIVHYYLLTAKFMSWLFREMDVLVKTTFIGTTNMKDYNAKSCKNYLLLRNLFVPDLLKRKREAVFNHKKSMKSDSNEFYNV